MQEYFETDGMNDNDPHWDALSARIAGNAMLQRKGESDVLAFAGSGRGWLVAGVLVAVAAGGVFVIQPGSTAQLPIEIDAALEPADNVGRAITASPAAPSVGELVLTMQAKGTGGPR